MQPGPQQRGRFHVHGKHPARAANKSGYTQFLCPTANCAGVHGAQHRRQTIAAVAITRRKGLEWLAVGQVQPTTARKQEFAPDGGHGVVDIDAQTTVRQDLSGAQARRSCAHNDDIRNRVRRGVDCRSQLRGRIHVGIVNAALASTFANPSYTTFRRAFAGAWLLAGGQCLVGNRGKRPAKLLLHPLQAHITRAVTPPKHVHVEAA